MFYVIFTLILVILCATLYYKKEWFKNKEKNNNYIKLLVLIFVFIAFINVFLPDGFAYRFIDNFELLKETHNPLHAILRGFYAMSIIVLPIAVFFKKKSFIKVTTYITLPTILLNIIFYFQYISYYTSPLTEKASVFGVALLPFTTNVVFRSIIFGLIMGLALIISLYVILNNKDKLKFTCKKEVFNFIILSISLFISNMPIYTIQQITGDVTNITFNFMDPMHFIYMVFIVMEVLVLTLIFKNKSYDDKYILLLVLSLSLLFQYNSFFKTEGVITATRYPLQLCNIAGAFILITLITKNEKMFHFTAVVNVTGALIAIILCDSTKDVGFLYSMNIHYMTEHTNVLIIPLLALILGVFKPLKISDIKHFFIGFTIYYLSVFVIGTILNGLASLTGNGYFSCNYLFMFNKDAATRLIGSWVGILFDIKLVILNYFEIHLVQILVYVAFLVVCALIFFGLYAIFRRKVDNNNATYSS